MSYESLCFLLYYWFISMDIYLQLCLLLHLQSISILISIFPILYGFSAPFSLPPLPSSYPATYPSIHPPHPVSQPASHSLPALKRKECSLSYYLISHKDGILRSPQMPLLLTWVQQLLLLVQFELSCDSLPISH